MRKITVFTGSRAEYGLLHWLMKGIQVDDELTLQIIVSGMHLSPQYGETWREIVADGFVIDEKVEMLLSTDSASGVVKSMGLGLIGFADALSRLQPDCLVVLGDRFEALAVVQAALIMKIPVAHIHGGELTVGAYDNSIRHAITKMASLHFVAADAYRRRVIQMGEEPHTAFNVGAPGLEHVSKLDALSCNELAESIGVSLQQPYILLTYHPVTLDEEKAVSGLDILLETLEDFGDYQVLFTYPNADNGNHNIINRLARFANEHAGRVFGVKSLGYARYLNAVAHASVVVGNSSSGIIEVPSFGVPTVNIGVRQQGRLAAESVIQVEEVNHEALHRALTHALTLEFKRFSETVTNPYGDGEVAAKIISALKKSSPSITKSFYDMECQHAKG